MALINVIGASFNITDPGVLSWLIAGYSLTVGTFILISGRLGDLFGYKRLLIIGFSWFSLWSMIAGLAVYSNHVLFIFARVFQGIGPAIVLPNGMAIFGATYAPGRRKAMVFAIFGACAPNGSIAGAAMAGTLALAWWPWAFWVEAIALAVIAVVAYYIIPNPPRRREAAMPMREKIVRLDLLGAVTGVAALVLINVAWNQAPIVGWQEAYVFVLLIIGILVVLVFFYIELRVSQYPLIPFDALTADVSFVLGAVACGWACFGIWFYYTWSFFLNLRHASPLLASAWISPVCPSGAFAALCTGWMLGHFRPGLVMTMSLACFMVGTILIMTAPIDQTYWAQSFVASIVTPWGMDMSFPAATLILSNAVKKEHQGIAASLVNTVVNYSISIALGFAGTVEVHVSNGEVTSNLLKGYRGSWYLAVGLAGLGLAISAVFLARSHWHDYKRSKAGNSPNHVDAP
jgi:MFS family permease